MNIQKRVYEFRKYIEQEGVTAAVVMLPDHQYYLSGFKAIMYSRPIFLIIDPVEATIIVPGLEELHAQQHAHVDTIKVYYEQPEKSQNNYKKMVEEVISKYPSGSKIGLDFANAPTSLYQWIQDLGYLVEDVSEKLVMMRYIKEEAEIAMMKKAGELVNIGVKTSVEACILGISEIKMDTKGNNAINIATSNEYPDSVLESYGMTLSGKVRSTFPHAFSSTRRFEKGDVLIHSRQVSLNGYRAELERTVIIGKPSDEQEKLFELATEAQQKAIDYIRPGVTASEVDQVARDLIKRAGVGEYAVHRIGHGLGISPHEEPYVRFDNNLVLEEGMVFCIEPGIYVPGIGGFRHSDTVVVRKAGAELITEHPKTLNQLAFY